MGQKNSPTVLNENGKRLLEDIMGTEFLNKNLKYFTERIDNRNPKTALDVETLANEVLVEEIDNDMFIEIKNILYSYPAINIQEGDNEIKKYAATIIDACFVISIPLRDEYLKMHPELVVSNRMRFI